MQRPSLHRSQSGQVTLEYAILAAGVIFPTIFGLLYLSEMLWVWHSVADFTRDGANYASTHCWQAAADNVISYMKTHVPLMIDQDQFINGTATIEVNYYSKDPTTGFLVDFSCDTECNTQCIPDVVTVRATNYQFTNFVRYLGLPPVTMPDFVSTATIESAGCDPDQDACFP